MNFKLIVLLLVILGISFVACEKQTIQEALPAKTNPNLKYFGYVLIDVLWDDPLDSESKTNYIDEVSEFTNIADILVVDPTDNIQDRIKIFNENNVEAVLHLNEIFFEIKSTGGTKSGSIYGLREDFKQRWDTLVKTNKFDENISGISCFYIGEEPAWNGISEDDFTLASNYAKETIPIVPILNVEAYPDAENIYTPQSVDWLGFDHYFLKKPSENEAFLSEYNAVKSKLKDHQKLMLIMDAHWIKLLHGSSGISKNDMDIIARDYYNMANSDTLVVGILAYFWPGGFDVKNSLGSRNLPDHVLDEQINIGKAITGKP